MMTTSFLFVCRFFCLVAGRRHSVSWFLKKYYKNDASCVPVCLRTYTQTVPQMWSRRSTQQEWGIGPPPVHIPSIFLGVQNIWMDYE